MFLEKRGEKKKERKNERKKERKKRKRYDCTMFVSKTREEVLNT